MKNILIIMGIFVGTAILGSSSFKPVWALVGVGFIIFGLYQNYLDSQQSKRGK